MGINYEFKGRVSLKKNSILCINILLLSIFHLIAILLDDCAYSSQSLSIFPLRGDRRTVPRFDSFFLWYPQLESNQHLPLRRGLFYPLNYRDAYTLIKSQAPATITIIDTIAIKIILVVFSYLSFF